MKTLLKYYFDYAGATPLCKEAYLAMEPYFKEKFYNPSAIYLAAQQNKKELEEFRRIIAGSIGAKPSELVFTAGGTEANNMAIQGVMRLFDGANLIISSIEHESVIEPAKRYDTKFAKVDDKGVINLKHLESLIDENTVLISVMYANNEIGTIEPIKQISALINKAISKRKNKLPLYLHTDACQAANYLDMQTSRLGVDLMTINAGKIYGPKQCGALFIKTGVKLSPLILGGGQEKGLRSGTENLANIAGFAAAWQQARKIYKEEAKRVSILRDEFIEEIQSKLPNVQINGLQGTKRLANNVSANFKGADNERLLMLLDEAGFEVATGSACSASSQESSHVLKAIGLTDNQAQSSLRITLGRYTTKSSIKDLANKLISLV